MNDLEEIGCDEGLTEFSTVRVRRPSALLGTSAKPGRLSILEGDSLCESTAVGMTWANGGPAGVLFVLQSFAPLDSRGGCPYTKNQAFEIS